MAATTSTATTTATSTATTTAATTVRSVCPYCGVGCGLLMDVGDDGRIRRVSGDPLHPANRGRLCTKGQTCAQVLQDPGRLRTAFLREDRHREAVPVGVDAAIRHTAQRLRALVDQHGPDAVALYVSGQMSLEAQYLANKLAKGFIGTNQIESNSRLCMASASSGYKLSLGADAPPGSYEDFEHAELFLVIGANMADSHPILFLRMMERVKAGARLIVVDPRRTATADKAHLHLPIRPGTDLALLNGLLHLLHAQGHTDPAFIEQHTEGWAALSALLPEYPPEKVSAITGVSEADLRQAAQWIGASRAWMSCWTMGLNQSTHGTWNTNAVCNLHLATGAICRPGAGPFSLTGQPNAMGGREMGYMGPGLPGQRSVLVERDREVVEDLWAVPRGTLHTRQLGGTVDLFERMAAGDIKACWIICTNPVASVAKRQTVLAALQRAELVIVQDAFLDTETTRHADVLLPGALWAEADGVMVNSERNLTLAAQAVLPPGEALPDWQIIARVACEMGYGPAFDYRSAAEVFDELTRFWNPDTGYDVRGASHERLRHGPLQWPCPPEATSHRHPIRYLNDLNAAGQPPRLRFPTPSGKARLWARPHVDPAELPDAQHPWVLNTGRLQHQWHTLTKTGKIPTLNKLNPGPFVEVHPEDAAALAIRDRDSVEIRSRRGRAVLPAVVTDRVRAGTCFAPIHWNDVYGEDLAINAVTHDAVDPVSLQPEFKFSAVALRRVGRAVDVPTEQVEPTETVMTATASPAAQAVTVLWASQTGRAESVARHCAQQLQAQGWSVALTGMDRCRLAALPAGQPLLLLASTFGDGDPPDNAAAFWRALQHDTATQAHMAGRPYAVLAFGDPNYEQFCGFGRQLDARLGVLGGERLVPRVDCPPEAEVTEAQTWLAAVTAALAGEAPTLTPVPGASSAASAAVSHAPGTHRQHPLPVRLRHNRLLNAAGASKETRQIVFGLGGADLRYEAGDALGVWPQNSPALVAQWLAVLRQPAEAAVTVAGRGEMSLAHALSHHLDLTRVTPDLLDFVRERDGDPQLAALLQPSQTQALRSWLWGRQALDVLQAFPVQASVMEWLAVLKRLQPRLYSIASSPTAHAGEVHLTVSTVRWQHQGQARGGVCSTFLADRAADVPVPVFVQPSPHFRLPSRGDVPMIMIGPGTGVAPFRGFLHERQARGDRGRHWLFFGEQHAATDFYYRDELLALQRSAGLTRLSLAFSRDQADKVYVQDCMREEGAALWAWLQEGAHLYVCGDASRMARDVEAALLEVVQKHGGLSLEAAQDFVAQLVRERRYVKDVY